MCVSSFMRVRKQYFLVLLLCDISLPPFLPSFCLLRARPLTLWRSPRCKPTNTQAEAAAASSVSEGLSAVAMTTAFASMRFGAGSPKEQIMQLVDPLSKWGIKLVIYEDNTGDIKAAVHKLMDKSHALLACGTDHYGEITDSPISSAKEIDYWEEYQSPKSIVSLRMFPFDQKMKPGNGRPLFMKGVNQTLWPVGAPLTDKVVQNVAKAILEAAAAGNSEPVAPAPPRLLPPQAAPELCVLWRFIFDCINNVTFKMLVHVFRL